MKRIVLIALLSLYAIHGFSQSRSVLGVYGGAGIATNFNYDVSMSGGLNFMKGINSRMMIGAVVHYQQFSLYYDREQGQATNGNGNAGVTLRHKSADLFVAPKFEYCAGRYRNIHIYVDAGIGFNMGGFDSLHKWDHSYYATGVGNYDSSLDLSSNINKMLVRVGMGVTEYLYISRRWCFTFTQDIGFIPGGGLTKTGDYNAPARTPYSPGRFNPTVISLQIGISRVKY